MDWQYDQTVVSSREDSDVVALFFLFLSCFSGTRIVLKVRPPAIADSPAWSAICQSAGTLRKIASPMYSAISGPTAAFCSSLISSMLLKEAAMAFKSATAS